MADEKAVNEKNRKNEGSEENGEFLRETHRRRPVNKGKLARRTLFTVLMAILFGVVACVTFLYLQPVINEKMYPTAEPIPNMVRLQEDSEEMSPEEMLSEYMQQEALLAAQEAEEIAAQEQEESEPVELPLSDEQVQQILSKVTIDKAKVRQIYSALYSYTRELNRYVVTISGISSDVDWLNTLEESSRQTSGVVVAENGLELLILADYTPLSSAEYLLVSFSNGEVAGATFKELDPNTNLAILAVELEDLSDDMRDNLPIANLGTSTYISVGTPVVAMGSPMGTPSSLGYGMISAAKSTLSVVDATNTLLQTDIVGSATQASGVLFNLQSQVVGIITTNENTMDAKNLVSAYGITDLKKRIEKMANGEKLCYLGISGTYVTSAANTELGVPFGAFVKTVAMDSPAMMAGIQTGDVITQLDASDINNFADYVAALQNHKVGDVVTLTLMRKSQDYYKSYTVDVEIVASNDFGTEE
jgi:serine protease Do